MVYLGLPKDKKQDQPVSADGETAERPRNDERSSSSSTTAVPGGEASANSNSGQMEIGLEQRSLLQLAQKEAESLRAQLAEAVRLLSLLDHSHLQIENSELKEKLKRTTGTYSYPFGVYSGELVCGIPNGKGTVDYKSGKKTQGSLFNHQWEGHTRRDHLYGKVEEGWTHRGQWHGAYSLTNTYPVTKQDTGCMVQGKWHGPSLTVFPKNGARQFSLWQHGDQTGEYCWLNGPLAEARIGKYVQGKCLGEKRVLKLSRLEQWKDGNCISLHNLEPSEFELVSSRVERGGSPSSHQELPIEFA